MLVATIEFCLDILCLNFETIHRPQFLDPDDQSIKGRQIFNQLRRIAWNQQARFALGRRSVANQSRYVTDIRPITLQKYGQSGSQPLGFLCLLSWQEIASLSSKQI
jgi:hypothetical protein